VQKEESMNARRLLLSAAVVPILVACGTGDGQKASSEDPGVAAAKEQILATSACREDGATLNVPSEKYPTIAAALVAAKSGDTVRVAAGTYQECVMLVDGVTLSGPEVRAGQPPAATLDGTGTCRPVVFGDATILHGATIKGFRIINAGSFGIWLMGSNGVHVSDVSVEGSPSAGFRADQSSIVLEHSNFLGNGGVASVRITQGSRAVLVANDIVGVSNGVQVENGLFLNDPMWAPSQAWMINNVLHDNGVNGLLVRDKGSEVRGVGNRYEANRSDGVSVAGGAIYVGKHEAVTNSAGNGVTAWGCLLRCPSSGFCSSGAVLLQEATVVTLDSVDLRGNQRTGLWAACGATINLRDSKLSGNGENGGKAELTVTLDAEHMASAPSFINARNTEFAGNQFDGLWLIGKGVTGRGSGNRYSSNTWGLHVSGGANYFGARDGVTDNLGVGVSVFGHEVRCGAPDCNSLEIALEESLVKLEETTLRGNYQGVVASCGSTIELWNTASTRNKDSGVILGSTCDWGELGLTSAPSILRAHDSVFAENPGWGVIAYEDSQLLLGSLTDPGGNSFLGNLDGAIANITPNPVLAQWNWFGTNDAAVIASSIVDCRADSSYGCVEHVPFLSRAPRGNGR
jgi:hypothetical protein